MVDMVRGDIEKLAFVDPNFIQRDMLRLILHTIPQRNKYLRCTVNQKRFLVNYDSLDFVTYPFGFRFE